MASISSPSQEPFDKELWKHCCQEELVTFVTKASPEYPYVLQRYRDLLKLKKTPEYIQHQKYREQQKETREREWRELINSEEYKQEQKSKQEQKEQLKKSQQKAALESISWGT